jgi:hypothetical protein
VLLIAEAIPVFCWVRHHVAVMSNNIPIPTPIINVHKIGCSIIFTLLLTRKLNNNPIPTSMGPLLVVFLHRIYPKKFLKYGNKLRIKQMADETATSSGYPCT